jgi:hypothetical protein
LQSRSIAASRAEQLKSIIQLRTIIISAKRLQRRAEKGEIKNRKKKKNCAFNSLKLSRIFCYKQPRPPRFQQFIYLPQG